MYQDYTQYVNTNIGTIGHLLTSTSPTVQSPHGSALLAPVFLPGMKDRYLSDKIYGFQAGCAIVMPNRTGSFDFYENASVFDHDLETARPHYYEVLLEDSNIRERHTAMENFGVLEFDFPQTDDGYVTFYVREGEIKLDGNRLFASASDGRNSTISTLLVLDGAGDAEAAERKLPQFYNPANLDDGKIIRFKAVSPKVTVRFVISALGFESCEKCWENKQIGSKTYESVKADCQAVWNEILGKVRVTGGSEDRKTVFYTSVYRAVGRMHNYSVNGEYIGFDGAVHADNGHEYYCDDGIWDTYRGMHPLQMILEPKAHADTLASYLRMYQQSGWLPRFPYLGGNVPCMLGHHTVSLYADALAKGFPFDLELAYEAAYKNATRRTMLPWKDGEAEALTQCYYEKGFFPGLEEDEEETSPDVHEFENRQSVAVTMEHSYDDWCVAQLALALGKKEEAEYFLRRSENYKNVYNAETGFVHPRKADGSFTQSYNPKFCGGQGGRKYFAENNAYIYNFHVQHDLPGLIQMHGGKNAFAAKLDNLFVEQYDGVLKSTFLMQYPDATGLMGQFCMGNEPSFHIPYLYNYCGQAYKTQRKVREIIDLWFPNSPLGICGDEDGGAMCSWLVFSAMGFYPVCPGTDRYDLGSPLFDRIEITMPNGKTFTVCAEGASGRAKYIQSAEIDGKPLEGAYFTHADMMNGGTLTLEMGERPNKELFA